jgi:hypothetical protein
MDVAAIIQGNKGTATVHLVGEPNECPVCHRSIHPLMLQPHVAPDEQWVEMPCRCTSDRCGHLFLAQYSAYEAYKFSFKGAVPLTAVAGDFPESVTAISPAFITIYGQAMSAESHSLDQLVGIGLRKALEFLFKDFAVHLNPNDKDKILGMQIGPCIDAYATDPNLRGCAKRATWLGNDETHYLRKWDDKDIKDLKVLVKLTVNWMDSVILTGKYATEMNPPAKAAS